jgi:hypothetical protein
MQEPKANTTQYDMAKILNQFTKPDEVPEDAGIILIIDDRQDVRNRF